MSRAVAGPVAYSAIVGGSGIAHPVAFDVSPSRRIGASQVMSIAIVVMGSVSSVGRG